jgi:predicted transcriptional regulator
MKGTVHTMGRGSDKLLEVEKGLQSSDDPEKMLHLLFNLINFKQANTDIYFLLNKSEKPLTVRDIYTKLPYSERTIRTYLGVLSDKEYIKKIPTLRERPCFAYKSIPPKEVWGLMVEQLRRIKHEAGKTFKSL